MDLDFASGCLQSQFQSIFQMQQISSSMYLNLFFHASLTSTNFIVGKVKWEVSSSFLQLVRLKLMGVRPFLTAVTHDLF